MHNKSLRATLAFFAFIVAGAFAVPVGTTLSDIVFVDPKTGSDSNPGSITYPCKTVAHVMATHSTNEYLEIVLGSRPGTIHVARTNLVLSGVNGMSVPELYIDNMSARVVIDGLSVGALRPPVEQGSGVNRPIVLLLHGAEIRSIPDTRAIVSIYSDSSVKLYEHHPNVISRPLIDSDSVAFSGSWWWGTNNTTLHDAFGQMALMFPQGEEDGQVLAWNSELNKWEWRGVLTDYWKAVDGMNWVIQRHYVTQSELSDTYSTKEWVTEWFDANMVTHSQLAGYLKASDANAAFASKESLNNYLERAYSNEVRNATNDILLKISTVATDIAAVSNDFTNALYIVSNKVFETHNPFVDATTDTSQHLGAETTIVDTDKAEFTGSVYISDLKTDKAEVESKLSAGSITLDDVEISSWSDLTGDIDNNIEGLGDVVTNNYNTFTNLFTNLIDRADGVDLRLAGIDEKLDGYDQDAIDSVGGLSVGLQEVSNTLSDVNRDLGAATDTLGWLVPSVGDISNRVGNLETATGTLHEAVTEIKGTLDAQTYTSGWFQVRALAVGTNAISDEASAFSGAFVHGISNTVSADNAYAAGFKTQATEEGAHSEGYESEANGKYSFAGGYQSKTYGDYSFAYGSNSIANNDYSIALGLRAWAEHNNSFIWSAVEEAAQQTVADGSFVVQPSGGATNFWVGDENLEAIIQRVSGGSGGESGGGNSGDTDPPPVSGDYLALTGGTLSGPLVIGTQTSGTTPGTYSFAQGNNVAATGKYSMASGNGAFAAGKSAHAFGEGVRAEGGYSMAAGYNTVASNAGSFALGTYVSATDNYAFVWSGTSYTSGSFPYRSHGAGTFNIKPRNDLEGFWIGARSLASILGDYLSASALNDYSNHVAGTFATKGYVDEKVSEASSFDPSVLDGYLKTSGGTIDGTALELTASTALRVNGNAKFSGAAFLQGKDNAVVGGWSHAEGLTNRIEGGASTYSHVEGISNLIYESSASHVEGVSNQVINSTGSHVEGWHNVASSSYTHVSGVYARSAPEASNSFVWSGVPSGWYSGLRPGSFNINPAGGIENMWIGKTNLHDHIVNVARTAGGGGSGSEIIVNSQPAGVRLSGVTVGSTYYSASWIRDGQHGWTYSIISNQNSYVLLGYTSDYIMFNTELAANGTLTVKPNARTYGGSAKTLKIQISANQNTWTDNEKDLSIDIPKSDQYADYETCITNYTGSSSVYIRFSCPDAAAAEIHGGESGDSGNTGGNVNIDTTELAVLITRFESDLDRFELLLAELESGGGGGVVTPVLSVSFDPASPLQLTEGTASSVTATARNGETPYTYVWESATAALDGLGATLVIPGALTAGTYTTTVTVTDDAGAEVSKPFSIVVSAAPGPGSRYTVTFKNYDGTVLSSAEYDYGTIAANIVIPSSPTRAADAQYTYTFNGWSPTIADVTGDAIYTATYASTIRQYTIIFKNSDGTVISSHDYDYGTSAASITPANPTKPGDTQNIWEFNGWSPTVSDVTGNATYVATYTAPDAYTVIFNDYDGRELLRGDYLYWTEVSDIVFPEDPTRRSTAQFDYTFTGWSPTPDVVTQDVTYVATYRADTRHYAITFVDGGGLSCTYYPAYNEMPSSCFETTPSKPADEQYASYTFTGWSPALHPVIGPATYTATYEGTLRKYNVKFVDDDGSTLKSDTSYDYGTPVENIVQPATPTKADTVQYTYTFAGWTPELAAVTADVVYTATYTQSPRLYTISWDIDGDGTVDDTTQVAYNELPTHADGSKAADAHHVYTFTGWDPEVTAAQRNTTYTAQFSVETTTHAVSIADDILNGAIELQVAGEPVNSPAELPYGTEVTVVAIPDADYTLSRILLNSEELTGNSFTVTDAVQISAEFVNRITSNGIRCLTDLGQTVWRDIAINNDATRIVFAGDDSYLWEEGVRDGVSAFSNSATTSGLLPKQNWKSVAMSADGRFVAAFPDTGKGWFYNPNYSRFYERGNFSTNWVKVGMSKGGASYPYAFAISDTAEWIINSGGTAWTNIEHRLTVNPDSGIYMDYNDVFATDENEILFSGDKTLSGTAALRRFTFTRNDSAGSVINSQLALPSGIPSSATVVTRMPYGASATTEENSGSSTFPTSVGVNTNTEKIVGGPWVDVVVDSTAPHPLYVRTAIKWIESTYTTYDTGETQVVTNWNEIDTLDHFTTIYRFRNDQNIFILTPHHNDPPEEYDALGLRMMDFPDDLTQENYYRYGINYGTAGYEPGYPDVYSVCTDPSNTSIAEGYSIPNPNRYSYSTYKIITGIVTNHLLGHSASVNHDRMADAYEPIQAAGTRHWADVAVSADTTMTNMWAVEADGHVWRMTGASWRTGTWASQTPPGTNMWKQVVCSTNGNQALVVGDCMVPTNITIGNNQVQVEANAWYFSGANWYPIYQQIQNLDETTSFQKWNKAFISRDGYTAYFIPEGSGYIYKLDCK